jgi:RNA polymerase sigma-70 factor (ECF subfamily)
MEGPHASVAGTALGERLLLLWERTGDDTLRQLAAAEGADTGVVPSGELADLDASTRLDWISTALMNCYKSSGDPQVFAVLYDLNRVPFMQAIQNRARRAGGQVDAQDVLQEVFLNIYRYPHRFVAEKADSFRNWGHRIVRNTLLKFLKGRNRLSRVTSLDDEIGEREDTGARSPFRCALEAESANIVDQAYLIYLNLYLLHFRRLSEKEQRALTLVEVEGTSYKHAAKELGIRLENLKMVIFRGRRKIFRGLQRTLEDLTSPPPTSR